MPAQPTPEVYQKELAYLQKEQARTEAFEELTSRFEDPSEDLVAQLRSLHASTKRGFILDPEKLKKLKEDKPELHNQILPVYMDFLQEKSGF